MYIFFEFRLGY